MAAALAAALALASCTRKPDDEIRVVRVPKEEPPPVTANMTAGPGAPALPAAPASGTMPAAMQASPDMIAFANANPTPKWSPPADWVADNSSAVRKGSWRVPPAPGATGAPPVTVAVNVFAGQLGGLLENVRRWHGRADLSTDIAAEQLPSLVQNITIGGFPAQYVAFDGPNGRSLDGALIFLPDRTWSFVLSGDTATVKAQRDAFRKFLDSVEWPK